jgi:ribosomal protein S18 acetylase RimI-like enzyme
MTRTEPSWFTLPDAPSIPGLRFRTYADDVDIAALLELFRAVNAANGDTEEWTADELRLRLVHPTHVDPRVDDILAFVGADLIAASSIEWLDSGEGRLYQSSGRVHPDWRRRGIGGALMTRNELRLVHLAASHAPDRAAFLTTWFRDGDVGAASLARERGYRRVRVYHHMTRPDLAGIETPTLPEGLEVRDVDQAGWPRLWEAMMDAFRDHFGGEDDSPAAYQRWSNDENVDPSLWVVAFDADEIAGAVLGYIIPEENEAQGYRRGWVDPVFVRRPWRRRGLAGALLGEALVRLRERGMTSAQLEVDSENANQALGLYERHGFAVDRSSSEWHKPLGSMDPRPTGDRRDELPG